MIFLTYANLVGLNCVTIAIGILFSNPRFAKAVVIRAPNQLTAIKISLCQLDSRDSFDKNLLDNTVASIMPLV